MPPSSQFDFLKKFFSIFNFFHFAFYEKEEEKLKFLKNVDSNEILMRKPRKISKSLLNGMPVRTIKNLIWYFLGMNN